VLAVWEKYPSQCTSHVFVSGFLGVEFVFEPQQKGYQGDG